MPGSPSGEGPSYTASGNGQLAHQASARLAQSGAHGAACSCRLARETRHKWFCLSLIMWPDGKSLSMFWVSSRVVMTMGSHTYW